MRSAPYPAGRNLRFTNYRNSCTDGSTEYMLHRARYTRFLLRADSDCVTNNGNSDSRGRTMIVESLLGLSLVLHVSLDAQPSMPSGRTAGIELSTRRKQAALLPLVQRATDCILREVSADPRYRNDVRPDEVYDLILDSIVACGRPVRAMIEAHDRMYGLGSGEAFLVGPYLDVLPSAVVKRAGIKNR